MNTGNFQAGLEALGAFESGKPAGDPEQYRVQNTIGFTGKYQFGEALLIDLGYYEADTFYGAGASTNLWQGAWTDKAQSFGVNNIEDFRNSPEIQEAAIRDAFELNWDTIETVLGNSGKTVEDYIGKTITVNDQGEQKAVEITPFGILAGAHLRGAYGLANLLLNGEASQDEYGTSIVRYVDEYAGYDVPSNITGGNAVGNAPVDEFNVSDTPVEQIDSSDAPVEEVELSDSFTEESNSDFNDNSSLTGSEGVENSFSFTYNWGESTVIENFDSSEDSIDLRPFWFYNDDGYSFGEDSNGNAVIDIFSNNQTIILDGVSQSELQVGDNVLIDNNV